VRASEGEGGYSTAYCGVQAVGPVPTQTQGHEAQDALQHGKRRSNSMDDKRGGGPRSVPENGVNAHPFSKKGVHNKWGRPMLGAWGASDTGQSFGVSPLATSQGKHRGSLPTNRTGFYRVYARATFVEGALRAPCPHRM